MFDEFAEAEETATEKPEHAKAHGRIAAWGRLSPLLFLVLGLGFSVLVFWTPKLPTLVNGLVAVFVSAMFAAAGLGFGVAVGCLQAPREFFATPAGRKWMRLVGTRNVTVLRVICVIVTATIVALVGIAAYVAAQSVNGHQQ
jgi:hypothetical protein